eukprot:9664970-Prorocentrum_lima.AAC.1
MISALQGEIFSRKIEYSLLLNVSGHIVASANEERQWLSRRSTRLGERFDPGGIVTRARANNATPGFQLQGATVVSKAE